jgi:N-acetylmuramoyl-L-alanine amidase
VLDPGHGTPDPGAVGPAGTKEKDGNFALAQKLATLLGGAGAAVYLTRTGDGSPAVLFTKSDDLWSRVNIANDINATLFVSIHTNAGSALAHGTETYYSELNDFNNTSESYKLASSIQDKLVNTIGLTDRGVKTGDHTVLNHTKMPAVLVEVAFIANPQEEQLIASDSFRQKAANGIYQGILAYKGLYPTDNDILQHLMGQYWY